MAAAVDPGLEHGADQLPPESDPHRTFPSIALGPRLAERGEGSIWGWLGRRPEGLKAACEKLAHPQPSSKEGSGDIP